MPLIDKLRRTAQLQKIGEPLLNGVIVKPNYLMHKYAEQLANELFQHFEVDKMGWQFGWDRSKRNYGMCRYKYKLVTMSFPLTSICTEAEIRETILHEIAHILCPGDSHNWTWKRKYISMGGNGCKYSYYPGAIRGKIIYQCPTCGNKFHFHRTLKLSRICVSCRKIFETFEKQLSYRDYADLIRLIKIN